MASPTLKELVEQYRRERLSIFPLPFKSKRDDSFKWGEYQSRLATDTEIAKWFNGHPSNVAVVCGQVSGGLVVVEFDNPDFFTEYNGVIERITQHPVTELTRVTQGKRGPHVWFRVKGAVKSRKTPKCEIRSDGNYIVVPPSVHPEGPQYRFLNALPIKEIDSLREVGIDIDQEQPTRNQPGWVSQLLTGVGQGGRNDAAAKLAGYFRDRVDIDICERLMLNWNQKNSPPLPMNELLATVNSVYRYPQKPTGSRSSRVGNLGGGEGEMDAYYIGHVTPSSVIDRVAPVTKRDMPRQSVPFVTDVTDATNVTQDIVRTYLEDSDGQWIEYRDLDNDLGIRTPVQKAARRKIVQRLVVEGFIEKHPSINTKIRKLKSGLNRMSLDFEKQADYLPLKWPFGIEEKVDVYPKSLVVVAGSKDAGKTAFCLSVARRNADLMKVHYFNSEMGDVELMNRLRNFEDYKEWAHKIDWIERAAAFEDVIFPNDLNIIDFLEVTTEFYLVSATLSAIYRKLENGIVLVALQKDPRSQYGRGGAFSVEKARLYVTLNHVEGVNTAAIESGKMWHNAVDNPRGQYKNYKLAKGCYFVNESVWKQRSERKDW